MKKDDRLVTKEDLEVFGNKLEQKLEKKLTVVVEAKMAGAVTKLKYELKDEQTKFLGKIYGLVDGLALEVRDNREFRVITTNQIVEDRERIGKLEKRVFGD